MTAEEVIKTIELAKAEVEWEKPLDWQIAFDMAVESMKKQIQKKPKFDRNLNDLRSVYICECGKEIICLHGSGIFKNVISQKFCPECGQAIGFGEGE